MTHGLDTGFLVAAEVIEHAEHSAARQTLSRLLAGGDRIAMAPQVLAEFIHIVTDPRRFSQPLNMPEALRSNGGRRAKSIRYFPTLLPRSSSWRGCTRFPSVANDCSIRFWQPPITRPEFNRS